VTQLTPVAILAMVLTATTAPAKEDQAPVKTIKPTGEGIMGMKVESVATSPGMTVVTATGAVYVFDHRTDRILCHQRIGQQRKVAEIELRVGAGLRLRDLKIHSVTDRQAVFRSGKATVLVRNDSGLCFAGLQRSALRVRCTLKYARRRDLFSKRRGNWGYDRNVEGWFDGLGGFVAYGDTVCYAVMPPRVFDFEAYRSLRPAELGSTLWGFRGTERVIRENRNRGVNLFVIWGGTAWETDMYDARKPFKPADQTGFRRVIEKVHRQRNRVMVYLTSGQLGNRGTPETLQKRIDELVAKYHIDGVYLDGPSRDWSRQEMFDFLRDLKRRRPKLLVFMHRPLDPLAEAYLDAKIIGESDRIKGQVNADAIDSRQWSNVLVFWVPDHNIGRTAQAVDTILEHRAAMYWGLLPSTDLPGRPDYIKLWQEYYLPKLDELYYQHLRDTGRMKPERYESRRQWVQRRLERFMKDRNPRWMQVPKGLAGKVTASSQEGLIYYPDHYKPANAADGSLQTCWLAAADRPDRYDWSSNHAMSVASLSPRRMAAQWLQLELPKEQIITRIVYDTHWPGQPPQALWQEKFRISVSTDGRNWTAVAEKSDLKRAQRFDLKITPVNARFIRVDGIHSHCKRLGFWHGAYVTELQVYAEQTGRRRRPRRRPWQR